MACEGYSDKSLMGESFALRNLCVLGNWYEERIAEKQESKLHPDKRYVRSLWQNLSLH